TFELVSCCEKTTYVNNGNLSLRCTFLAFGLRAAAAKSISYSTCRQVFSCYVSRVEVISDQKGDLLICHG
ncbi:hypothetical protein P5673_028405, partial [Acropora cervicornis]